MLIVLNVITTHRHNTQHTALQSPGARIPPDYWEPPRTLDIPGMAEARSFNITVNCLSSDAKQSVVDTFGEADE